MTAAIARFYNEVRMARQVTHPNVCRVYDIGEVDGQQYISMESWMAKTLPAAAPHRPLALGQGRRCGPQDLRRLAAAHEKGVLHCDLKPANVMIDALGKVVLMDFGFAGEF